MHPGSPFNSQGFLSSPGWNLLSLIPSAAAPVNAPRAGGFFSKAHNPFLHK